MERQEAFQDSVNKKVLLEWVRITGLANPHKRSFDRVLLDFSNNILKYPKDKPIAFSWSTAAGISKEITAIRAKITYDFWRFFLTEGRQHLAEYNIENHTDIRISKEQTIKVSDTEKLGLYLRKFIREMHLLSRRKCPEILYKKGMLHIGKEHVLSPAMAAFRFDVNLDAWIGLPLENLFTPKEKESIEKGEFKRGELRLTGINLSKPLPIEAGDEGPERKRSKRCEDSVNPEDIQGTSKDN
ncbi:unnamed protein product [Cylicocyclus nassatus]|uniref:Uncharacterized protein n=1 Tax=Cylicocyclus nassatus TaxID=53992 RepID=A0AA36DQ45_CYLNA|nr:unnamed protein product [Cylicocyclus nassatus]